MSALIAYSYKDPEFQNLLTSGLRGAKAGLLAELQDHAEQIAEDAVQKTLGRQPQPSKLERYCYVTARHAAFGKNKRHAKEKAAAESIAESDQVSNPAPLTEDAEIGKQLVNLIGVAVNEAISRLNSTEQAVIKHLHWDGLNSPQISARLKTAPYCVNLSAGGVRKCYARALGKLLPAILASLRANAATAPWLIDALQEGPKCLGLLALIREILFGNGNSIELMANKVLESAQIPPKLLPRSAQKYKIIASRKEELVGEIISGVTEYSAALDLCKAELGENVVGDFLSLLRQQILAILIPSDPNKAIQEKLEKLYKQTSEDIHEFQRW